MPYSITLQAIFTQTTAAFDGPVRDLLKCDRGDYSLIIGTKLG